MYFETAVLICYWWWLNKKWKKKVTAVFGSVGVGIIFDVIMFAVGDGGTRKRQTGTGLVRLFATEMMVIGGISSVTTLLWRCRRNRWLFHSVKFQLPWRRLPSFSPSFALSPPPPPLLLLLLRLRLRLRHHHHLLLLLILIRFVVQTSVYRQRQERYRITLLRGW